MGYVAEVLSGTPLEVVQEFHSHLETQALLDPDSIKDQISFSYAGNTGGDEPNLLAISGGKFDLDQDPTRSVHLIHLICYAFSSSLHSQINYRT